MPLMKPAPSLPTLTAGQLAKAIAKADALSSALCSEMIAAGRGYEKSSETRAKSDPLAVRCNAASRAMADLMAERDSRRQWHGSDRPIRRVAA